MPDAMEALKGILGDGAEDKIKSVMNSLSAPDKKQDEPTKPEKVLDEDFGQMLQLKNMIESMTMSRSNPRTNLLMALKPYLSEQRQQSVDNTIKMMGVLNLIRMLGK